MLGPLEVRNGGPVALGGRKQRTLLAALLLRANEVVAKDGLIEALWPQGPPPSAGESLETYIYRLRKLVGHDRLRREAAGYRLVVGDGELDVERFQAHLAGARAAAGAGDHAAAVAALNAALGLWRGPAWSDLLDDPLVGAEAERLEELRVGAQESFVDARLASGEGVELVPELERLVAEHPLRERLLGALMLALYRAGRQTDALDAFRAARERLVQELGLEPGPELHELQQRILRHAPSLSPPRRTVPAGGPRRRRLAAAASLALVAAAVVMAELVLVASSARPRAPTLSGGNGVVAIDAAGRVVRATGLSAAAGAVASSDGSVWVAAPGSGQVLRIDSRLGGVVDQIGVGGVPGSIAGGGGAVWVASSAAARVTRIDPTSESVTQTINLPGANPDAIAYGAGRVWVADAANEQLFELDPSSGSLERTVSLDLQPTAVIAAGGKIWVAGYNTATVEELAAASGRVLARVRVGDGPVALAFGSGSLWVANSLDATVSRIDPAMLAVTSTIPVGSGPAALVAESGSVWVANQYSGTVARIDPRLDRVNDTVHVSGAPTSLAVSDRRLWAGVAATGGGHRGGTLVIVAPQTLTSSKITIESVDPAFYTIANNPQFTGLAYDSLVTFEQSTGADGLRLVPDLAVSIPTPTNGDRTYAFRIRPGIRYSDGQPLRAGDFRRGIERLFRVRSQGAFLYDNLVGASACVARPRNCNLENGVVTDDSDQTVTFHFKAPDPEFLFALTEVGFSAPVPPRTPDYETGSRTVPGTGPYEIAPVTPYEVRFVRNPFFREWSHAAQPAGNPDSIVWRSVPSIQAAVADIDQGRADWLWGQVPAAQYNAIELQDPALLHVDPQFSVEFAAINTHRPPFNDPRVRQALNYAINRATIVQQYGGPVFASPICQPIAPGLPGYRRYCPYTLHPNRDGTWTAPDLARARRLIAESGTRGERIDIWGSPDEGFIPRSTPGYVAGVLRELGYRVHLHLVPLATVTAALNRSIQISVIGDWTANYPDPASYIPPFFACDGGNSNGYYCNPQLDHEMDQAELLETSNPAKARATWDTVDRQLTNNAVWLPTVTFRQVELTSPRLRNYEYNPVWGFLADQAWLR